MSIKKIITALIFFFMIQYSNVALSQNDYIKENVMKIKEAKEAAKAARQNMYNIIVGNPVLNSKSQVDKVEQFTPVASELMGIYPYAPDLWFYFLFLRRDELGVDHILEAQSLLKKRLYKEQEHYHKLVYYYNITSEIPRLEGSIDSNLIDTVYHFVSIEKKIPAEFLFQLKNMATLANLGNEKHEDELLNLVATIYKRMKEEYGLKGGNKIRQILYKQILPYTIGVLYSKKSTLNILYLIEDLFFIPESSHTGKYSTAKNTIMHYIYPRIYNDKLPKPFRGINFLTEEIPTDVEQWRQLLSSDDVWKPIVSY